MTNHDTDERVIHTESDHYNATLVRRVDQRAGPAQPAAGQLVGAVARYHRPALLVSAAW